MDFKQKIKLLLEEITDMKEGDSVQTNSGNEGKIQLSKHPYYSVTLDNTGVTKTYHYDELTKIESIESEFGKYDIDNNEDLNEIITESPKDEQILFKAFLEVEENEYITEVLSSIRGIKGVTIVNSHDIPNSSTTTNLTIKIDPYPFQNKNPNYVQNWVVKEIRKMPQIKTFNITGNNFEKNSPKENPNPQSNPMKKVIPVKSINQLKERIKKTIQEEKGYSRYSDGGENKGLTTSELNKILLRIALGEEPKKDWGKDERGKN